MPQPFFGDDPELRIKTHTYERLMEAISQGLSPLLLSGVPASGKSTILRLVFDEWIAQRKIACLIPLARVFQEEDLFALLRHGLLDANPSLVSSELSIIGSSGRRSLESVVELISSLPAAPLILLDGLDETRSREVVLRFVRLMSRSTRALFVVSTRGLLEGADSTRLFRETFVVPGFTLEETAELIARSSTATVPPSVTQALFEASKGSPLFTKLFLSELADRDDPATVLNILLGNDKTAASFNPIRLVISRELNKLPSRIGDRETAVRLLSVLAILGRPLTLSDIVDLGINDLSALRSPLLLREDDTVCLIHAALAEPILEEAGLLPSSGTHLRDLRFGAEEAERDQLLAQNFIVPAGFSDLALGMKNIVIGDRGAGKSAMFAQLTGQASKSINNTNVQVIPIAHPDEMLKKLEANDTEIRTAEQFRAGWLTLAAFSLAISIKTFPSRRHKRAAGHLATMLGDDLRISRTLAGFLWETLERIWSSSVKFSLGPVVIESAAALRKSRRGSPVVDLYGFIADTAKLLEGENKTAIIALDRIDEIHKYDRTIQEDAIRGLFLAESYLAQVPGVSLLIFLRSDLFEIYGIQEKNKLVSRSMSISWTKTDLLRFLVERVLSNSCFAELRKFVTGLSETGTDVALRAILPDEIEDMPAEEWLWEWMENGNGHVSPRQFVLLLTLAVQSPVSQTSVVKMFPIFPTGALQWAMDRLSELSFKELVDDFGVAPTFLSNCRAGRIDSFRLENVTDLFNKEEDPIGVQVDLLVRLGFLERVVVQQSDGQKSSEFRVPKLFTRCWALH